MTQPAKYGLIVFAAVFFVGWITGMGGAPILNFLFSVLMGLFAGGIYALLQWYAKNRLN